MTRKILAATAIVFLAAGPAAAQEWALSTDLGGSYIHALAAAPGSRVWAAPSDPGSLGRIFCFDGVDWSLQTLVYPEEHGQFFGAFALDGEHAWMASEISRSAVRRGTIDGGVFFFDQTAWSQLTNLPAGVNSVYASDPDKIWTAGRGNLAWHSEDGGATWTTWSLPEVETISSLSGAGDQNLWAAGMGAGTTYWLLHFDGAAWTVQTGPGENFSSVAAAASGSAWAGGEGVLRYDGSQWSLSTDLGGLNVNAVAARNGEAWAGTESGDIFHYNGTDWTLQTTIGDSIRSLNAAAAGDIWAGGDGKVYRLSRSLSRRWITDYDGDGTSDIGIFRLSSGLWSIRGLTRVYFGSSTDLPVPGDYDGDGTTAPAVFRPENGLWAVRGVTRVYFGSPGDIPRPGDYTGDGTTVPAVYRPSSGLWAVRGVTRLYFGGGFDIAVPGYYRGGLADPGIFRYSTGLWAIRGVTRVYFGSTADDTAPGDYTGEGAWRPAVFRPGTGLWAARGMTRAYFGTAGDQARPGDYSGNGTDDIAVFRSTSGLWAVRGLTRVYFGGSGDLPVTR